MKSLLGSLFCCIFFINSVSAQSVEMADVMRSNGKIYVVVAVIAVIFIGLAIYLFRIDQRVKKLEE